jgi:hypothetical protein
MPLTPLIFPAPPGRAAVKHHRTGCALIEDFAIAALRPLPGGGPENGSEVAAA